MLDLTRVRYFQAVAEAGSFSRAARRLGLSQPTLSVQVARLEEELGAPLLQRHRNGVRPTETGRRLLTYSQDLFSRIDEMEHSLRSKVEEPAGELRIGTVHSVGIYILPEVMASFSNRYTKVRPSVRIEHSENIMDMLHAGNIDIAFTAQSKPPAAANNLLVADDPMLLVCGPGHRLWGRRYVRPRDLDGEKLLGFDEASPTARLIDRILTRNKVNMVPIIRTPCIAALIRMVGINMGLAFLPSLALEEDLEAGKLHAINFSPEELHRGIWASWNSPEALPARDTFLAGVKEAFGAKKSREVI